MKRVVVFLALLCVRGSALELAKCSRLTLSPTTGLCIGSSFAMNKCTGGSNAFEYSAAGWATSVSDDTQQLERVTDSICYDPFDKLCMSYVAVKVNVHQLPTKFIEFTAYGIDCRMHASYNTI
jgi:hypothetical protein